MRFLLCGSLLLAGCSSDRSKSTPPKSAATASPPSTQVADDTRQPTPLIRSLRRPLQTPTRAKGVCRPTLGRRFGQLKAPVGRPRAIAPGVGPVYPNFVTAPGGYRPDRSGSGRYVAIGPLDSRPLREVKILWAIESNYQGPALIRGRSAHAPDPIRFGSAEAPKDELLLPEVDGSRGWRTFPSYIVVARPGCYALQIDTSAGSSVIEFELRAGS